MAFYLYLPVLGVILFRGKLSLPEQYSANADLTGLKCDGGPPPFRRQDPLRKHAIYFAQEPYGLL